MKMRSRGPVASSRRRRKAVTSEVVSSVPPRKNIPQKWRRHYNRLNELRNLLVKSRDTLKDNADEESPNYSSHMADAATDNYDRDFALSMLSSEQNAIYEIEQALNRIQDGSYGICEVTGKPIGRERLVAIPWTRFSLAAEKDLEERGQVRQTKLAEVARVPKESTESGEERE